MIADGVDNGTAAILDTGPITDRPPSRILLTVGTTGT
jgi:hypothetical protein